MTISLKQFLVIWKNTEYNIGSAFDETTGKFTAPHDGIYFFYATSPLDQYVTGLFSNKIYIYVNGSSKVYHHLRTNSAGQYEFTHNSPSAALKLSKGDIVHIRMNGYFYYASTQCDRTYFQGHLVDLL